jgi:hypothetical protein
VAPAEEGFQLLLQPNVEQVLGRPVVDLVYMGEANKFHDKYVGLAW